jgi:hypothetical protein
MDALYQNKKRNGCSQQLAEIQQNGCSQQPAEIQWNGMFNLDGRQPSQIKPLIRSTPEFTLSAVHHD